MTAVRIGCMMYIVDKETDPGGDMSYNFTINGTEYKTDKETVEVLRSIKKADALTAVQAVMALGLHTGRIQEV